MGTCHCVPPARLHVRPDGVHLPDGGVSAIVLVDELGADDSPQCSVCATLILAIFYSCASCDAVICRTCLSLDTDVIECDCAVALPVTGVQLAARRAAAAQVH